LAILGSGRRARFFIRLAEALPEQLRVAGVVARRPAAAAQLTAETGVRTFSTLDELLSREAPDFVASLVSPAAMPDAVRDLVARGVPVLAETPPAPDEDSLRSLWADVGSSGLVQVNEQYLLMPTHAARLTVLRRGVIGEVTSVQVSSTHLYHAVSLMRGYLDTRFEGTTVQARSFVAPLADPLGFDGWSGDATPRPATTTIATIDFGPKMGLYDFTDNQWWNPLRSPRLVIRGSNGELVDDRIVRLVDPMTPVESRFLRRQTGVDLDLEHLDLREISFDGEVVYRNPFSGAARSDDDIAVADLLARTGSWARGEASAPYPLADACQDQLIALAIARAVRTGEPVTTGVEGWTDAVGH
jgi:predicted dehydrogenase